MVGAMFGESFWLRRGDSQSGGGLGSGGRIGLVEIGREGDEVSDGDLVIVI